MKKRAILVLILGAVSALLVWAQEITPIKADVSFTYTKQSGMSSNQFAVWIEDAQGNYIKTLYATKFTATGGWKKRGNSLPLWVKQSNLGKMEKNQIDALTGSTPKAGQLLYTWDGTDSSGKKLPSGEYRVFVEATLRGDNAVLYSATILPGESKQITADAQYTGTGAAERGMIGPVTVSY